MEVEPSTWYSSGEPFQVLTPLTGTWPANCACAPATTPLEHTVDHGYNYLPKSQPQLISRGLYITQATIQVSRPPAAGVTWEWGMIWINYTGDSWMSSYKTASFHAQRREFSRGKFHCNSRHVSVLVYHIAKFMLIWFWKLYFNFLNQSEGTIYILCGQFTRFCIPSTWL